MVSLLIATLLTAEGGGGGSDIHGGAALGFGAGAPFRDANTGFQMSLKAFVDIGVADKITVGAALPIGFGFYGRAISFASVNYVVVDVMPSFRGRFAVMDWIHAAIELGLGPAIFNATSSVTFLGQTQSQTDTRTYFAMRAALLVEVAPPSLSGVMFFVEPVAISGRLDQAWSEYRFSIGVGYRR